jgi:fumarate reductase subunit C
MPWKGLSALAAALALTGTLATAALAQRWDRDDDRRDRDWRDGDRRDRDWRDGDRREWVLLGERKVNFGADRDVIDIEMTEDWWANRGFRRLHLMAERSDIHLMSVRLVFMNGYSENFDVDRTAREGQDHTIDLRGEMKYLRRIELFYRSRPGFDRRAIMKVYGEPARFRPGPSAERDRRQWVLLGERRVNFRTDRDVVEIAQSEDWWRNRGFRRLHLIAERSDIRLISLRLVYMNGYAENIDADRSIREGEDFPIDLRGERKYLQRIEFVYRSRPGFEGRAIMKVYGVPARF